MLQVLKEAWGDTQLQQTRVAATWALQRVGPGCALQQGLTVGLACHQKPPCRLGP